MSKSNPHSASPSSDGDAPPRDLAPRQSPEPHGDDQTTQVGSSAEKSDSKPPASCPVHDLVSQLRDNAATDTVLGELWDQVNAVPDWVDWPQIARGQDVFYRYGIGNLTGLFYQSLLGGQAFPRIVETLARTGGFSVKVARGRLFETTQWVLQCTRSLDDVKPGGEGWDSTVRVRLLHAMVRQRILKLAATRPEYYSVEEAGIPINDFHSILTMLGFSASLIWRSLPAQGIYMTSQEQDDFMALWRYVGYVIGCPVTPYLETREKAKATLESIMMREMFQPSKAACRLADNLIESLIGRSPTYPSRGYLLASARWLNGNELCDALGLDRPGIYHWMLVAGQTLFIAGFVYMYRLLPSYDASHIALLRRGFWLAIVESKFGLKGQPSKFDFKHVPNHDLSTEGPNVVDDTAALEITRRRLEVRSLATLLVATTAVGVLLWMGFGVVSTIGRRCVPVVFRVVGSFKTSREALTGWLSRPG